MSAKSTNSGFCALCGQRATKTKMMAHVEACAAAHDEIGQPQPLVVLRFGQVGAPRYWLVIEAKADAQLGHVDALLRRLWLECCGHMSAFRLGRRELAMTTPTAIAFTGAVSKVEYEYDFGSTTALTGELVGKRHGSIGRASVRLLARNEPLVWPCVDCEAPATVVCPYCINSNDGFFCDAHADVHEHAGEEVYLPVVNSPRMGVCAYTG
ncbi:MAG: hypothetical protein Q8S00_19560 [Deltaproteobacteria bacterium]|nr:hypothetical protein [Deltaproteobacteria bacterium]MDZ4342808.1 hypothetical protein [Candidatus Binatia bacterium]